jgi:acyl-coenzyme A synthetase/AMP-(fatty) acid ligase
VKQKIAPYKYPRKVEFVATLPRTVSGKISRRLLRDAEFRKVSESISPPTYPGGSQ